MRLDCVDTSVSWFFRRLGTHIALYPGYYIIVPTLLCLTLVTGIQRMIYQDDPEYLFSPVDGQAHRDRAYLQKLFPQNTSSDFDIGRQLTPEKFGRVIAEVKEGSLLRREVWEEILELDQIVRNMTVEYDEDYYKWDDLCARSEGKCFSNDIFFYFYEHIDAIENGSYKIRYPLHLEIKDRKIFFPGGIFGGAEEGVNGTLRSCKAFNLFYYLDTHSRKFRARSESWERGFLELMPTLEFQHIRVAYFTSLSLAAELENNTTNVTPFFSITVIIMLIFTVTTCMMMDHVRSKPWLGILGCLSAGLSVLAAFGAVSYCGLEFIAINMAAPFLMFGIGMDDTFVLLAAWRRTDHRKPVPQRMAETYAEAAVSVTITSFTNLISFLIGAITPFPSVRIFCICTAVCVLFTYVYQITFFGACMAINGYAERRNLHGLLCFPALPRSQAQGKSRWFKFLFTGGVNPEDPHHPKDNKEHSMMTFFRDVWGEMLCNPIVKAIVIAAFLLYLIVGIWGCTNLKEGLERYKLARDNSYAKDFFNTDDKYFRRYPLRVQIVTNVTLDYWDPQVYDDLVSAIDEFETSKYIQNTDLTECWFREFKRQSQSGPAAFLLRSYNLSNPEEYINGLRYLLKFEPFSIFQRDIKFNENFTAITASRCIIQATNISDANDEKDLVLDLRRIASLYPEYNFTAYHTLFVFFDQFILVRETTYQSIGVASVVMMVISMLFIPNIICVFWVAFAIISIEIGVVGYMTLWGVNLDSISMINLIMCIGFSVDFSAHISYAYLSAEGASGNERMKEALYSLGMPIFQGSLSTILGIIILAFAPSYIFVTFFKTVFLVITFGALHGVLLLPVLLTLSDLCKRGKKAILTPDPYYNSSYKVHPVIYTDGQYQLRADDMPSLQGTGREELLQPFTYRDTNEQINPAYEEEDEESTKPNSEADSGVAEAGQESPESIPRTPQRRHSSHEIVLQPQKLTEGGYPDTMRRRDNAHEPIDRQMSIP